MQVVSSSGADDTKQRPCAFCPLQRVNAFRNFHLVRFFLTFPVLSSGLFPPMASNGLHVWLGIPAKKSLKDDDSPQHPPKKVNRKAYDAQRYAVRKEKAVFWDGKWQHSREWLKLTDSNAVCTCELVFFFVKNVIDRSCMA